MIAELHSLLDCIFPPRCAACQNLISDGEGVFMCDNCAESLKYIAPPFCPICGLPYQPPEINHLCGECVTHPPYFQMARAMGIYTSPLLDLIRDFKYGGNRALGAYLGEMMAERNYHDLDFSRLDLIIPVPLNPRRLRERTFNQALILARKVAKRYRLPCNHNVLQRTVPTKPQVALHKEERKKNVKGAFSLSDAQVIKNKSILLVDDVFTTGGTVNECARVLLEKGAKSVYVLTLARTV